MAWQPQQESLRQLAYSLRDSLSGYDRARQKQAEEVRSNLHILQQTRLQICAEGEEIWLTFLACIATCESFVDPRLR
jgi:hypothetical protein